MSTKQDLYLEPGADFQLTLVLQDSDGVAVDITGATVVMQMRETYTSPSALLDATSVGVGADITITGLTGTIVVDIPAADTEDVEVSGVYEIRIEYASGVIERILEGKMLLQPMVVR